MYWRYIWDHKHFNYKHFFILKVLGNETLLTPLTTVIAAANTDQYLSLNTIGHYIQIYAALLNSRCQKGCLNYSE